MGKIGRPHTNDNSVLARMADAIYKNPSLMRTAAFWTVYVWEAGHQSVEAEQKRLVKKFGEQRNELMAAARQRHGATHKTNRPIIITIPRLSIPMNFQARFQGLIVPPTNLQLQARRIAKAMEMPRQNWVGDVMRTQIKVGESQKRIVAAAEAMQKSIPKLNIKTYQLPKGVQAAMRMQKLMPRIVFKDI
jgi:hypothetical protein